MTSSEKHAIALAALTWWLALTKEQQAEYIFAAFQKAIGAKS